MPEKFIVFIKKEGNTLAELYVDSKTDVAGMLWLISKENEFLYEYAYRLLLKIE